MLSYRHAYHAGNHADVLKHLVLIQIAEYLASKDKPFWLIDTHAGAGGYSLESEQARKVGEYLDGIGRLWNTVCGESSTAPAAIQDYLTLVRRFNPGEKLRNYPGSPWLAAQCLRPDDRLRLFEMHSTDARLLKKLFAEGGRQIAVADTDGLAGLKALLPPPSRRGMVLIDPSYELKQDYTLIPQALQDALKRFATGTYAIWYPQLARPESRQFPDKLKRAVAGTEWLHVTLTPGTPPDNGIGMYGSGMFVVNPPWTLEATLKECLPWIAEQLARSPGTPEQTPAGFRIELSSADGKSGRSGDLPPSRGREPVERKRPNRRTNQT